MKRIPWLSALLLVTCSGWAAEAPPVTAIYYHGNILTGAGLKEGHPQRVSAIAVGAHAIIAVGDDRSILQGKQPHTRLVDLQGAFVMPGINDAHVHMANAGQTKLAVDLTGCRSRRGARPAVSAADQKAVPGPMASGRRLGSHLVGRQNSANPAGSRTVSQVDTRPSLSEWTGISRWPIQQPWLVGDHQQTPNPQAASSTMTHMAT